MCIRDSLYTLHVTCGADVYDQTFGVRSIEARGTQVLLNGKQLYFKGFCKHEDFTAHGRGFDPVLNVKDVNLIHWANANAVRTSHYPYAEEFYDLCDREGILVMDETPAVGIGGGAAVNPYKEYPLAEHHRQVLAEMIQRDKNHPCEMCIRDRPYTQYASDIETILNAEHDAIMTMSETVDEGDVYKRQV